MTPEQPGGPLKRARPGEERDKELYFEDGNVVICCSDTDSMGTLWHFKVHRTVLARCSPVFKDMFALTPPTNEELYDGVPFVQMPDDSKDVKSFLRCFYEPCATYLASEYALVMRGALKLAAKYQVTSLSDQIITEISRHWPTSLDEWDRLQAHIASRQVLVPTNVYPEPVTVLILSIHYKIREIIPTLFYHLSRLNRNATYDGARVRYPGSPAARHGMLRASDWRILLEGKEMMNEQIMSTLNASFHASPPSSCEEPDECMKSWMRTCERLMLGIMMTKDPLKDLLDTSEALRDKTDPRVVSFCDECRKGKVSELVALRSRIWGSLHEWFRVPF